jgi:hypothetical protein
MAKWADYLISAVRYSPDHRLITEMKQIEDTEDSVGKESVVDKSIVAENIKKRKTYMTIISEGSNWKKGSKVKIFIVDGGYYIRADNNKVSRDNLGPLPEF